MTLHDLVHLFPDEEVDPLPAQVMNRIAIFKVEYPFCLVRNGADTPSFYFRTLKAASEAVMYGDYMGFPFTRVETVTLPLMTIAREAQSS